MVTLALIRLHRGADLVFDHHGDALIPESDNQNCHRLARARARGSRRTETKACQWLTPATEATAFILFIQGGKREAYSRAKKPDPEPIGAVNAIFYLLRTVPLEGLVRGDLPVELVHRGAFLLCRHPVTAGSPVAGQSVRETARQRLRPGGSSSFPTTAAPITAAGIVTLTVSTCQWLDP